MRLKSFTANTLPEAMRLVRDTLGPDAVILSTQPGDTGRGVRVTAALEDSPLDDLVFGAEPVAGIDLDSISEALSFHRVPAGLFDRLIGTAAALGSAGGIMALAGALDAELSFASLPGGPSSRPAMLIGPPGAGKTATAARLCARARMAGHPAAIVTMDTGKSGGLAQVEAFAEALDASLLQAADVGALKDAVAACRGERFVVIDTVGANPFDAQDIAGLRRAADAAGAEPILVLPAGGDCAEAAEAAAAFATVGARGMIATRLDAARRFGGLLSAAQAGPIAILAAGASPCIGDPLLPINPVALARLLLPGQATDAVERRRKDANQ